MSEDTDGVDEPRIATEADVEAWAAWLVLDPPYELVGRVVCEASALELGLLRCAHQAGVDRAQLGRMTARGVLERLRKEPHPDAQIGPEMLRRVEELLRQRNVLAHGAPMNVWGKPHLHGFTKQNRPTNAGYLWFGFATHELEELARELRDLAELVQSVVLTHADRHS